MGVPYCIVKGKARLGQVVHQKTATVLAVTKVKKEDQSQLGALVKSIQTTYNERYDDLRRQWGGMQLGQKAQGKLKKKAKELKAAQVEYNS